MPALAWFFQVTWQTSIDQGHAKTETAKPPRVHVTSREVGTFG